MINNLNTQGGHILVLLLLVLAGGVGLYLKIEGANNLIEVTLPVLLYAMKANGNGNGSNGTKEGPK